MLTVEELRDANSHERSTKQRAVGHFDRDASRNSGPVGSTAVRPVVTKESDRASRIKYSTGESIRPFPRRQKNK